MFLDQSQNTADTALLNPPSVHGPSAPRPATTFRLDPLTALNATGEAQRLLHQAAGDAARRVFGRTVFVRGVVEVSNFCRQNCAYCGMRRDNRTLDRFRIRDWEGIFEHVEAVRPRTMTDVNVQAGEDPVAVREIVLPLVRALRERTDLGVSVCLGTLDQRDYDALREAGASFFIIKLETGNAEHYRRMQAPGTMARRIDAIERLAASGWRVSSGCIVGLPEQTNAMLTETFDLLNRLPLSGVSVSPFIAGGQTPCAGHPSADLGRTLNALAILRLQNPTHIIPAVSAFNSVGEHGYARALATGANLVTVNLTPDARRKDYVIYKQDRFIMTEARVRAAVDDVGFEASKVGLAEYLAAR